MSRGMTLAKGAAMVAAAMGAMAQHATDARAFMMSAAVSALRSGRPMRVNKRTYASKYMPHQGERESARRYHRGIAPFTWVRREPVNEGPMFRRAPVRAALRQERKLARYKASETIRRRDVANNRKKHGAKT